MTSDLTTGVSRFQRGYYRHHRQTFRTLARHGQRPDTLFIACADSRVLPHVITSSMPGDLFELRNVGKMVPPHGSNCDATGSALEYSLHVLNVSRIIVCGHSHCGACAALLSGKAPDALEQTKNWIEQGRDVRELVLSSVEGGDLDLTAALDDHESRSQLEGALERAMVVHQLRNLMTYPEVTERTADGRLTLLGWHYSIDTGVVEQYDRDQHAFHPVQAEAPKLLSRTLSSLSSLAW